MRTPLVLSILLAAMLAGCVDEGAVEGDGSGDEGNALPPLHGWIFDPALVPIPDVRIEASAGNVTLDVETDPDGFYGVDGLPVQTPVVVIARAEGFISASKTATLSEGTALQLNFTLQPQPVIVPYHDTHHFDGRIVCQYTVESDPATFNNECGPGNNENQWQIRVGENFAGAVVEIGWDENTPASRYLRGVIECATPAGCGDDTPVFADEPGDSVLRLEVGNLLAKKYMPEGGIMLLTVTVDPANDANEAGTGAAMAVNQPFEVIASVFYHEPPPPGFSVVEE